MEAHPVRIIIRNSRPIKTLATFREGRRRRTDKVDNSTKKQRSRTKTETATRFTQAGSPMIQEPQMIRKSNRISKASAGLRSGFEKLKGRRKPITKKWRLNRKITTTTRTVTMSKTSIRLLKTGNRGTGTKLFPHSNLPNVSSGSSWFIHCCYWCTSWCLGAVASLVNKWSWSTNTKCWCSSVNLTRDTAWIKTSNVTIFSRKWWALCLRILSDTQGRCLRLMVSSKDQPTFKRTYKAKGHTTSQEIESCVTITLNSID